jgi:hypothetical protein
MAAAARIPAMIRPRGAADGVIDTTTRRTGCGQRGRVDDRLVNDQLRAIKPTLEEFFQLQTTEWQRPQFYIYEPGTSSRPSRQRRLRPGGARVGQAAPGVGVDPPQRRRGGVDAEPFGRRSLVFHGAGAIARLGFGIPLESEEGMFVAFRSDWIHEVKPVTSGAATAS